MKEPSTADLPSLAPDAFRPAIAAFLVFLSGASVLVLEILSLRLIAPYVGLTLEMSTSVIGIALAAIAVGAWFGGWLADRYPPQLLLGPLFGIGGALTLAAGPAVRWTGEILGGDDNTSAIGIASIAVFAPAAILSAISPVVVKAQLGSLANAGQIVGRLASFGTLGSITATFGTGFVLVAVAPTTVILAGLGVVLIAAGVVLAIRRLRKLALATVLLMATGGLVTAMFVPETCDVESRYHCIALQTDPHNPNGRILRLNSASHSYVDLRDPRHLEYGYIRAIVAAAEVILPQGPINALHIGAGGLTLPRYFAVDRPGTTSTVYEVDAELIQFNRDHLGFNTRKMPGVRVHARDGRLGTAAHKDASMDLVVGDAFGDDSVPWHLATREYITEVHRVVRPPGLYALNVIDGPQRRLVKAETATIAREFPHVAVVAIDPKHKSSSNYVILASKNPLPIDSLRANLDADAKILVKPAEIAKFTRGVSVLTDDYAPVDQLGDN